MEEKRLTPIKAIRAFCLECCGESKKAVKECTSNNCSLYAYRLGHNPNISKREMSDDQKQAARERLEKVRSERKCAN